MLGNNKKKACKNHRTTTETAKKKCKDYVEGWREMNDLLYQNIIKPLHLSKTSSSLLPNRFIFLSPTFYCFWLAASIFNTVHHF